MSVVCKYYDTYQCTYCGYAEVCYPDELNNETED